MPWEHMITLFIILSCIIPVCLMLLNKILFKKTLLSRNKISSFECGFESNNPTRTPFSLKFYLISVIFLIFDMEIALILPIPLIFFFTHSVFINSLVILFMMILFIGIIIEWHEGALKWFF